MSLLRRQFWIFSSVRFGAFFLIVLGMSSLGSHSPAQDAQPEEVAQETQAEEAGTTELSSSEGWPSAWVTSLAALSADDQYAATAQGLLLREAAVVRFGTGEPQAATSLYTHPASVWGIAVNDQVVCSSDYRGNLGVWSRQENKVTMHEGVLERWTRALVFSPDPDQLVAANEAGKLFVWSISQGTRIRDTQLEPQQVSRLVFSPNGDQLAAVNGGGQLQLISWPALEIQQTVQVSEQPLLGVAYSQDGTALIVGGADRKIWRVNSSGEPKAAEVATVTDWVTAIDRLPAGGGWMVGCMDGKVHALSPGAESITEVVRLESGIWDLKVGGSELVFVATRKHAVALLQRSWGLGYSGEPKVIPAALPSP